MVEVGENRVCYTSPECTSDVTRGLAELLNEANEKT